MAWDHLGKSALDKVRLSTEQITPGMKLGEPITNANGVTLMPSGIRLTPMFIARIRKWNIDFIDVYVDKRPDGAADPLTEDTPEQPAADDKLPPAPEEGRSARLTAIRLSGEQQDFARSVALDISRAFVNVKDNPLMMQLRTVVIKRLVMHGPEGVVNRMRRPAGLEDADGA